MKIALLTIWHEKNFGAEMQCYATVKALKILGYDVEVIDYRLSDNDKPTLRQRIVNCILKLSPEVKSFNRFWRRYIPSGRHYHNTEKLYKNPPQADLYLVGSDQVWNPDITKDKWQTYFFDFIENDRLCFSYASSFGEAYWEWPEKKEMARLLLNHFSKLSVREASGQKLLASDFGKESKVVLDPTLLHNDYNEIVKTEKTRETLVFYPLSDNPELETFAKELSVLTNLDFINTNKKKYLMGRVVWQRTSIVEWIKNISEASLVITPSFHGLAFSLIYKRQFIIVQNGNKKNRSSRITGLLKSLGLEDRFFTSIEAVRKTAIWTRPIDYTKVHPKLESLKNESWNYLKEITTEQ